jgi:hypothetical protein
MAWGNTFRESFGACPRKCILKDIPKNSPLKSKATTKVIKIIDELISLNIKLQKKP